jgi:hypothetical protein
MTGVKPVGVVVSGTSSGGTLRASDRRQQRATRYR